MENAIAAVQTKTISLLGAAKRFGVPETSLRRKWQEAGNIRQMADVTTEPKEPEAKPRVANKAERDQWWADHQAGLSARKISDKYGRSRLTITKEIKRREEAASQSEPTPTTASTPSVPSAGSSAAEPGTTTQWDKDPCLEGWNGALNDLAQKIYKREKSAGKKRIDMATQLAEVKCALEKTMKAASADHRVKAGKLLETDVKIVEAKLQKENQPGITDTLKALIHEAERIQKFASETLRLLQLQSI